MDVVEKLTNKDVAAFDQLLLAIRRLESGGGGAPSQGDLRNLRVIAQNLIQTKLDNLQILERYQEVVAEREHEAETRYRDLERDAAVLWESADQRAAKESSRKRVSNLEEQLELKNEECEYLRRTNADLQASKSNDRESRKLLQEKIDEIATLKAEDERLRRLHAQELRDLRKDYQGQIEELVAESRDAEIAEEEERAALEKQVATLSETSASAGKLEEELKFLKTDAEVKTQLVAKLRKENEDLSNKYRQQSSRARELTEELTTAHDQRSIVEASQKILLKEIQGLKKTVQQKEEELRTKSRSSSIPPPLVRRVHFSPTTEEAEAVEAVREVPGRSGNGTKVAEHGEVSATYVNEEEEEETSSSGEESGVLQERLGGTNPSARLLAPPSPTKHAAKTSRSRVSFNKALEVLEGSHLATSAKTEKADEGGEGGSPRGEDQVEIFWDGKWWRALVKDRNEVTKRMSVVFGPHGNELIQWVPFTSLRIRPVTEAAEDPKESEPSEASSGSEDAPGLTMDHFFLGETISEGEEEEDFQPYQQVEEVGDQQKKKKKRFKAFRRFSSMGKGRSAQGKRNRFMSSAT